MRTALRIVSFLAAFILLHHSQALGQRPGMPPGRLAVSLSTTTVGFPSPGITHFDTGWIDHPGMVVSVQSRPPTNLWELRLRADAADMGGYGKPVGDLHWRTDGSAAWTPVTGTDQAVIQGQGDQDITLYFRLLLDWTVDLPDSYMAGLTFTAVRP